MRTFAWMSLLCVIVLAGCHNEIVVRVQRVRNAPERQLQEDSRYGRCWRA